MVTNFSATNSAVSCWIAELRDINLQKDRLRFRKNMERVGMAAGYEISKTLAYERHAVHTPTGTANCAILMCQPVIATILRAGIPLQQGVLSVFDNADCAFIGSYRKHTADDTFIIDQQYHASPSVNGRQLILADPMLATGASALEALLALTAHDKPLQVHVVAAIAAPEGITLVQSHFPEAYFWIGAIDEQLNNRKYIVPGLGDAGDLAFGPKRLS